MENITELYECRGSIFGLTIHCSQALESNASRLFLVCYGKVQIRNGNPLDGDVEPELFDFLGKKWHTNLSRATDEGFITSNGVEAHTR